MAKSNTKKKPVAAKADKKAKPSKAQTAVKAAKGVKAAKAKTLGKKTKTALAVGDYAKFVGYADKNADPYFEEGDTVYIVGITDEDGVTGYEAIKADDIESYKDDPESVDGEVLAASEIKKIKAPKPGRPKKAAVEEERKDIVVVPELKKLLKKAGDDLVGLAKTTLDDINHSFFQLGGILAKIKYGKVYEQHGYDTKENGWAQFCLDTFNFKVRKAEYLISMYHTFSELEDFDFDQLGAIGWAKAAQLARYVTQDNWQELFELASESNYKELTDTLRTDYTADGKTTSGKNASRNDGRVRRTTFSFQLYEAEGEIVEEYLKEAQKQFGFDDMNQVFEGIVTQWAEEFLTTTKATKKSKKSEKSEKAGKTFTKKKAQLKEAA